MKESKIKSSSFNETTGVSIVTIDNKYGTFTGMAKKNPTDGEKMSRFFGCQIAEIRALRKSYTRQLKDKMLQLKTIQNFYDNLQQMRNYDPKNFAAHHARTMIRVYQREANSIKATIAAIDAWFDIIANPPKSNEDEVNSN